MPLKHSITTHQLLIRRALSTSFQLHDAQSHLPRVANPALWKGMVPKILRRQQAAEIRVEGQVTTGRRPGIGIAVLGLLVGSFAINIMALRREMANFSRKTETKLTLLREVIDKVKAGEEIDVKRLLGTGDPSAEAEWEEVLREVEKYNPAAANKKKNAARREQRAGQRVKDQEAYKQAKAEEKAAREQAAKDISRNPKFMM